MYYLGKYVELENLSFICSLRNLTEYMNNYLLLEPGLITFSDIINTINITSK